jgi:hypothetical protein
LTTTSPLLVLKVAYRSSATFLPFVSEAALSG